LLCVCVCVCVCVYVCVCRCCALSPSLLSLTRTLSSNVFSHSFAGLGTMYTHPSSAPLNTGGTHTPYFFPPDQPIPGQVPRFYQFQFSSIPLSFLSCSLPHLPSSSS